MSRPRSKYKAIPTIHAGVRYASKSEARYAAELDLRQRAGEVRWWIGQPTFRLGCPENVYRPDMLVCLADGSVHAVDVKGVRTAKFNRDAKLWAAYGLMPLHVVGCKGTEVINGGGARS